MLHLPRVGSVYITLVLSTVFHSSQMDYLDVPSASSFHPRPTFLGIYGHPFHEVRPFQYYIFESIRNTPSVPIFI